MATESKDQEPGAPGRRRIVPIGIAIAVGLLVGGGGGALVAGPLLTDRTATAESPKASHEDGEPGESGAGKKGGKAKAVAPAEPLPIHQLDNLVLNPARSGGTRFLMVTVAFAVKDQAAVDQMKARDPEVRDVVLGVLGTRTVAELTEVSARDSLKSELRTRVSPLFGKDVVRQIYFPQFVIQ